MSRTVRETVRQVNRRQLTNNTQRALHTLLAADGQWVPRSAFRLPSVGSRLRDLRKEEFGGFDVQCESAANLGLRGSRYTFYYRLPKRGITLRKLQTAFEGVI